MDKTYYLQDDITRIEDLIIEGLESGDIIALAGKILTCESNIVADGVTGLFATGPGTIRMLNGGYVDFSGSNPLPSNITIEGGSEEKPLPSYGSFGYFANAAAQINLRSESTFSGKIVSHCDGNWNRPQFANIRQSTATTITLDRQMNLVQGDVIGWTNGPVDTRRNEITVTDYDPNTFTITHNANLVVPTNYIVILLTSGFTVGNVTGAKCYLACSILGDELCFARSVNLYNGVFINNARINIHRFVMSSNASGGVERNMPAFGGNVTANIKVFSSMDVIFGSRSPNEYQDYYSRIKIENVYCAGLTYSWGGTMYKLAVNYRINGGKIMRGANVGNHVEIYNIEAPSKPYDTLYDTSEFVIQNTTDNTYKVYHKNDVSKLCQRATLPPPTTIPEAWQLIPNDQSCTAWHDEEQIVAPGRTLSLHWYSFIGDENTEEAGIQILDGDFPGFGQVAVDMGLADVITEYKLPADSPVMQWLPVKQIAWQNTSDKPKKVILRGWCKGGQIYSRIGIAQGGVL